jgi:hypothetical protein
MTKRQRSVAQENDLHRVRMTALRGSHMIMVTPMRRHDGAFGHPGHHLYPIQHLFHDPHPLTHGPFTILFIRTQLSMQIRDPRPNSSVTSSSPLRRPDEGAITLMQFHSFIRNRSYRGIWLHMIRK